MFHLSQDFLLLPLMLLLLDTLTAMLKAHASTIFLLEVIGMSVCFGSAFPNLNTGQSLRGNYSKSLHFAQNTLAWEHGPLLGCALSSPTGAGDSWESTQPSRSHPCCFSSSGAAEMEGLEILSTPPPTCLPSTSFPLLLKQKGKVSRKRHQLPKEDICVDNTEKKLLGL